MNTTSIAMRVRGTSGSPVLTQRRERRFWSATAIAMALLAFAGFAPSDYLKSRFGAGPELTPLLRLHGAVMTAWMLLLVTQTTFIAARGFMPLTAFGIVDLFIAAIAIRDFATLRRLHPATLWGGLFVLLSQPVRVFVSGTPAWMAFAKWLTA